MAKAQFDPSTLKASYNATTKKVQMVKLPGYSYGGGCPCEYESTYDCICFPPGRRPNYLTVNFIGLKYCSDDSPVLDAAGTPFDEIEFCVSLMHPDYDLCTSYCAYVLEIESSGSGYIPGGTHIEFTFERCPGYPDEFYIVLGSIDGLIWLFENTTFAICRKEYDNQGSCGEGFTAYGGSVVFSNPCAACKDAWKWIYNVLYSVNFLVYTADYPPVCYRCIQAHISTLDDKPPSGTNWKDYWECIIG